MARAENDQPQQESFLSKRIGMFRKKGIFSPSPVQTADADKPLSAQLLGVNMLESSEENISWDKFKFYFSALPLSIEQLNPSRAGFGDLYVAQRNSGQPITVVPMYIKEWKKGHHGFHEDLLLILALNHHDHVVGMRTINMKFSGPVIQSEGAVASAICDEGIASVLEQVRDRTMHELLTKLRREGKGIKAIKHTVQDENKGALEKFQSEARLHPEDPLFAMRFEHAREDRPRWETLFSPSSQRHINPNQQIWIQPNDLLSRGFCSPEKTVFMMKKQKGQEGTVWDFEEFSDQTIISTMQQRYLDKPYLATQMKLALTQRPE